MYGQARLYGVVQDGGHDCQLFEAVRQAVAQPLGIFTSYNLDLCTGKVSSPACINHIALSGAPLVHMRSSVQLEKRTTMPEHTHNATKVFFQASF